MITFKNMFVENLRLTSCNPLFFTGNVNRVEIFATFLATLLMMSLVSVQDVPRSMSYGHMVSMQLQHTHIQAHPFSHTHQTVVLRNNKLSNIQDQSETSSTLNGLWYYWLIGDGQVWRDDESEYQGSSRPRNAFNMHANAYRYTLTPALKLRCPKTDTVIPSLKLGYQSPLKDLWDNTRMSQRDTFSCNIIARDSIVEAGVYCCPTNHSNNLTWRVFLKCDIIFPAECCTLNLFPIVQEPFWSTLQ